MRKIKLLNTKNEPKCRLQKVANFQTSAAPKSGYFASYEENVFPAAREAILKGGKFYDMFTAGDGHELEDYTDRNGVSHLAHAKSALSSSMLAYNFFHWVSPEHPLTWHGTTFDKVYFEVKFPVLAKNSDGSRNNSPSNMDVVLLSDDCLTMLCIESKYTEHTHRQAAEFADAYFVPRCYYSGNPFNTTFLQLALRYNGKKHGYFAGIKQNVCHLLGISNIKYDADALAWFKAHNPFIEQEVMEKICADTDMYFTNLLYIRPEQVKEMYGNVYASYKTYPCMLGYFLFDHLRAAIEEEFLPYSILHTYPELFKELQAQMPEGLAEYLDMKYNLIESK